MDPQMNQIGFNNWWLKRSKDWNETFKGNNKSSGSKTFIEEVSRLAYQKACQDCQYLAKNEISYGRDHYSMGADSALESIIKNIEKLHSQTR